jgi:serine protease AprX
VNEENEDEPAMMRVRRTIPALAAATAAVCVVLAYPTAADSGDRKPEKPGPARPVRAAAPLNDGSDGGRDYTLTLGEQRFDPLADPILLPLGWDQASPDGPDLRLVQFTGPTQQVWLDELRVIGLEIVQYVYPHTYIVWGDPIGRDAALNIPGARWSGDFAPAFRVLPHWRDLPDVAIDTKAILYRGADTDAIVDAIRNLGGLVTDRSVIDHRFEIIGFAVSGARFQEIANIPGVYSIQPTPTDGGLRGEMSDQVCVNNVDGDNLAFPGYMDWLGDAGVDGSGVIIANVDGGVQDSHPDLVNRLVGCVGETCGGGATSGHGTHTAGIMAADGSSGILDPRGFLRGLGVAPGANLVEQVYSPFFTQPGGMLLLMTESYANGALLSGNSWGPAGTPRGYDDDTMQCDIGSRDTDDELPGDQPLLYVLSIMNGNGGVSTQGTPDEAKNIFTIGSTKMQNGDGSQILDINDISSNSAHGPCLDGRKIPHLVAPGCQVDSTYSGSGYNTLCGTSMASPHVSGAVALFIEHYRSLPGLGGADPSPALVKAAFLPVTHDLAGFDDADGNTLGHPFDSKQGWGRMNIPPVVDPPANSVRYFDQEVVFDNTGEEWSITLSPLDPSKPTKVMLVWTDAPGHGLGGSTPAWNNNLDLVVDAEGNTYYGNNFGVDGGAPDDRNNTEGVFFPPNGPASITVRVVAADINSDGLPNSGDDTDQDFALVAYNVAEEPGFALSGSPNNLDLCAPADAVYTIEVAQILGYDQPVTLSAAGHPAGTSVSFADNDLVPPASTTMTISGTENAAFGDYSIQITGVSGEIERTTAVGLSLSTATPVAPNLLQPSNGASDVSVAPFLEWTESAQAASYLVQIAIDAGFSDLVYAATTDETTHLVEDPLDTTTLHYWRVRGANVCGDGGWSETFSFTTQDVPTVLLVDDDDNGPDVQPYYTDALDALGVWYDLWDTNNTDDEPSVNDLAPYHIVIWFTGDEWGGAAGPGSAGESALADWLDGGGCLFISSQDYHYDRDTTPFMQSHLGVASVEDDVDQNTVTGMGVFDGFGPYGLSYPFFNYADQITANGDAAGAFNGNAGVAAISMDGGEYRTTYWAFPLETVADAGDRQALLARILEWCGELENPCVADLSGDDVVNVIDLLQLLSAWGNAGGPEDLNEDGIVNVLDLLMLLAAWGQCG